MSHSSRCQPMEVIGEVTGGQVVGGETKESGGSGSREVLGGICNSHLWLRNRQPQNLSGL